MIYVSKLMLPSPKEEDYFIEHENRTCFGTFYPFKIFPRKELREVKFDTITIFYGGNGSGKSTLINVMARKMKAVRYSDFNDAPFFDTYVEKCYIEYYKRPRNSCVLTSDDVFDYVLNARMVNENIDDRRNAIIENYIKIHDEYRKNSDIAKLHGLDDFERWKEVSHVLSPKKSMSSLVKQKVERDVNLGSNGETAIQYFIDRMDDPGVYFLDEPENSLSIEFQMQLVEYILATARATGTQFIIATHSPIFLSIKNARIYNLDAYPVETCDWTELPNVRKYYDFFMEHREEFERNSETEEEDNYEEPPSKLIGAAYSARLDAYSIGTMCLLAEICGLSTELAKRATDIAANPDLNEDAVAELLEELKEQYLENRDDEAEFVFEDARTFGIRKDSPYRPALMQMINYLSDEVRIPENDQVLIVYQLDTEEKIKRWFDWIECHSDEENGIFVSAREIVRASTKIGKGIDPD